MKSKSALLILCTLCLLPVDSFALPPSKNIRPPESKFIPDAGFASWQVRREKLKDELKHLSGSKEIKSLRGDLKKLIKDTHKFMKKTTHLDAREEIRSKEQDALIEQADMLANRYRGLHDALNETRLGEKDSKKARERIGKILKSTEDMLEDTAASLKKMKVEP